MDINDRKNRVYELLTRGVDTIYPSKQELEKILLSGKKLKLYQGFDPTGTDLHLGHMIGLRKLAQWQALGHHVIFLIGDGTGQAGDPSGKVSSREKYFTNEELRQNAKKYVMQASKIIKFDGDNPVEILYNGSWLNSLKLIDILEIAGKFTLQQLSERDMFQERIKRGEGVNLREFLYPMLQGYDSVAMDVDLEIGGSDQTFNMLCGRTLLKSFKNKDKFVLTTPLLEDSQGKKIGKSEGNVIGLTDTPTDLFGKILSLHDDIIIKGLEYLTDISMEEISQIQKRMEEGTNPMQFKKRLAFEIVKQLNSEEDARNAQNSFENVFQKQELPSDIQTIEVEKGVNIIDTLVFMRYIPSKSEAKRLIEQNGITLDGIVITDFTQTVQSDCVIGIGKRKFLGLKIK